MKTLLILLCATLTLGTAFSENLTLTDREALLDNLEKLRENVDTNNDARFVQAINAYRAAMSSDENTLEFYLKCVEKVEYTDTKRKAKDFRDWKKKEDANLSKLSFRRALRHQLRWLCLSLEAASSHADRKVLTAQAKDIVRDVFTDLKMMSDQESVLTQSPSTTVFAKAYDIDGMKAEKWPGSPLALGDLYENLFLPPYRNPSHLAELRAGWMQRIEYELAIRDNMARYARKLLMAQQRLEEEYQTRNSPIENNNNFNETKIGTVESMRPPEYKKFLADEVPELLWNMEIDLFKSGDESGAAKRMVAHLEKYMNHKSAAKWTDELTGLLKSNSSPSDGPAHAEVRSGADGDGIAQ